jgi:ABC-type transport system involved in multi-copper enzyme maturation permease subunit
MASLFLVSRAEAFKLVKQPLTWVFLLLLLLIMTLNFDAKVNHAQEARPERAEFENPFSPTPEEYHRAVVYPGAFEQVQIGFHRPAFSLLLLTVATVSQEFNWGTMRTILSREPGRRRLLVARLGALAAVAGLYLVIIWVGYGILGLWASYKLDGGVDLSFVDHSFFIQQLAILVRVWLAIMPVITFGLFVAIWARNAAISITLGGMAYFLAWMSLMVLLALVVTTSAARAVEAGQDISSVDLGMPGLIVTLSPIYNMNVVVHWGEMEMMTTDESLSTLAILDFNLPHDPWRGLGLLLGYSCLSLALAGWLFWRVDVTA